MGWELVFRLTRREQHSSGKGVMGVSGANDLNSVDKSNKYLINKDIFKDLPVHHQL